MCKDEERGEEVTAIYVSPAASQPHHAIVCVTNYLGTTASQGRQAVGTQAGRYRTCMKMGIDK